MNWKRTEEEVDEMIEEMMDKKGNYITQGVAFKKDSESQIKLLKFVLMSSYSFGSFMKEVIAEKMRKSENEIISNNFKEFEKPKEERYTKVEIIENNFKEFEKPSKDMDRNVGNFL